MSLGSTTTVALVTDGYMGANLNSAVISCDPWSLVSIHYWISAGSPTGTLDIQVSNQESNLIDGYTGGTTALNTALNTLITQWVSLHDVVPSISFTAYSISGGSPSSGIVNIANCGFKWIRIKYTASSGTGTLQARLKGKRNKNSSL